MAPLEHGHVPAAGQLDELGPGQGAGHAPGMGVAEQAVLRAHHDERRHVDVAGRAAKLTEQEFRLLYLLVTSPGVVFSRESLLAEVWGTNRFVTVRSVDTLVSRLRRRIEPGAAADEEHSRYVQTVRGVGYKLNEI